MKHLRKITAFKTSTTHPVHYSYVLLSKEKGKDQDTIQSSATPDPGHRIGYLIDWLVALHDCSVILLHLKIKVISLRSKVNLFRD